MTALKRTLFILFSGVLFLAVFLLTPVSAQVNGNDLTISNYTQISKKRVGRTIFEFTYKADVTNSGSVGYVNVTATVTSNSAHTVVVDGELGFPDVAAGATKTSIDTFSFRQDRKYPFNQDDLVWEVHGDPASDDSDDDGVPDNDDNCPNTHNPEQLDSDYDNVGDACDECPNDPDKVDPGICGCGTPDTDSDNDGVLDCNDGCPDDPDKVEPGECGCGTPDTDSDNDGVPDCNDLCAATPSGTPVDAYGCSDMNISGTVTGGGLPIGNAQVTIGTDTVIVNTQIDGTFTASVTSNEWTEIAGGKTFLIEVTAPCVDTGAGDCISVFATGYAKVSFVDGTYDYNNVIITLIPISDIIGEGDDVTGMVEISKGEEKVGELTIPEDSFPEGVSQITGTVAYIDPTTSELGSFPGGDFLALPTDADPNNPDDIVSLESLGLMQFDLQDQNGNPITELNAPATVCMKVPEGLDASAGEEIPLWYYDPAQGLWIEDGVGTVEDRGSDEGLWMCGQVSHFTWWNYDRPIQYHACFKFRFVDETTENPITSLTWYAKGIDYSGTSPERPCNCDADDPDPCPNEQISSFTVMKNESIRVYTFIGVTKYYLQRDGDGTYSVSTNIVDATSFNTPSETGSCILNQYVENCHFLDELDPICNPVTDPACDLSEPAEGDNGILPLGGINCPPVIANLVVPEGLTGEETAEFTADINDPEGETVSVVWSATYGTIGSQTPPEGTPTSVPFSTSANYTAPAQDGICMVTLTATDSEGNTSEASRWIWIHGGDELTGTIEGTLYGPNGQPVSGGIEVSLISYNNDYNESVTTDAEGHYVFNDVPCCIFYDGWLDDFSGMITTALDIDGTTWNCESLVYMYCFSDGGEYDPIFEGDQIMMAGVELPGGDHCIFNIHFPVLWGTLSGTAYNEDGTPDGTLGNFQLGSWDNSDGYLSADIPVNGAGTYGPAAVPVGGNLGLYKDLLLHDGESVVLDIGPGAVGTMGGYLYSDDGNPIADGTVKMGSEETVTTTEGYYSFADVETGREKILTYEETPGDSSTRVYGYGMVMQRGETARADIRGRGCTVTGTLYNYDGTIMPFAEVTLAVSWKYYNAEWTTTLTDVEGVFTFENLGGSLTWPNARNLPTGYAYIGCDNEDNLYRHRMDFSISENNSELTVDLHMNPPYQECGGGG